MSLSKDHMVRNDYPCHSKVKKNAKKASTANLRARLKNELKKEVKKTD